MSRAVYRPPPRFPPRLLRFLPDADDVIRLWTGQATLAVTVTFNASGLNNPETLRLAVVQALIDRTADFASLDSPMQLSIPDAIDAALIIAGWTMVDPPS